MLSRSFSSIFCIFSLSNVSESFITEFSSIILVSSLVLSSFLFESQMTRLLLLWNFYQISKRRICPWWSWNLEFWTTTKITATWSTRLSTRLSWFKNACTRPLTGTNSRSWMTLRFFSNSRKGSSIKKLSPRSSVKLPPFKRSFGPSLATFNHRLVFLSKSLRYRSRASHLI